MVEKVLAREAREKMSDADLFARAEFLQARYLPEFRAHAASVKWRNMDERWGSCTTVDRTIRISSRLNGSPDYVLDYILVHELIHLEIPDHGESFHSLLARYEKSDLANSYLEGYEAGARGQ